MIPGFDYLFNSEFAIKASNDEGVGLFARLNCDEDLFSFGPFSVRVFITKLMIEVDLQSASSTRESWYANEAKPTSLLVKFEIEKASDTQASDEQQGALTIKLPPAVEISNSVRSTDTEIKRLTEKASYTTSIPLVTFSGAVPKLRWSFNHALNETYLYGTLMEHTQLCKIYGDYESVEVFARIPKYGIIASPARFKNIKDQRKTSIIGLLVRRAIAEKPHQLEVTYP